MATNEDLSRSQARDEHSPSGSSTRSVEKLDETWQKVKKDTNWTISTTNEYEGAKQRFRSEFGERRDDRGYASMGSETDATGRRSAEY